MQEIERFENMADKIIDLSADLSFERSPFI